MSSTVSDVPHPNRVIYGPPAVHVSVLANPISHTAGKIPPSLSMSGLTK